MKTKPAMANCRYSKTGGRVFFTFFLSPEAAKACSTLNSMKEPW
jgi:hypothetical protein